MAQDDTLLEAETREEIDEITGNGAGYKMTPIPLILR